MGPSPSVPTTAGRDSARANGSLGDDFSNGKSKGSRAGKRRGRRSGHARPKRWTKRKLMSRSMRARRGVMAVSYTHLRAHETGAYL
eukprot:9201656-Pyramimonas_sp.AAC.1